MNGTNVRTTFNIGGTIYPMTTVEQARIAGAAVLKWKADHAPPDPRIARDRARAEIDVVLREDARRFPAFATARRAGVLAHVEADPARADVGAVVVDVWIDSLHRYERERGGLREPSAKVRREWMMDKPMMVHYERNRGAR